MNFHETAKSRECGARVFDAETPRIGDGISREEALALLKPERRAELRERAHETTERQAIRFLLDHKCALGTLHRELQVVRTVGALAYRLRDVRLGRRQGVRKGGERG